MRDLIVGFFLTLFLGLDNSAFAQNSLPGFNINDGYSTATLGMTAATIVPAAISGRPYYMMLQVPATNTAIVACRFGSAATPLPTPSTTDGPSLKFPASTAAGIVFVPAPKSALRCIAAGSGQTLTVWVSTEQ